MFEMLTDFAVGYVAGRAIKKAVNGTISGLSVAMYGADVKNADGTVTHLRSHREILEDAKKRAIEAHGDFSEYFCTSL